MSDYLPALRPATESLCEQRHEDLGLLLPEAGQVSQSLRHDLGGPSPQPDLGCVAAVVFRKVFTNTVDALAHRCREAVDRWLLAAELNELGHTERSDGLH